MKRRKGFDMVKSKVEYRVWIWNKVIERFILTPGVCDTYIDAQYYLEKFKRDHMVSNFDFTKYLIKRRTITYSEWEVME